MKPERKHIRIGRNEYIVAVNCHNCRYNNPLGKTTHENCCPAASSDETVNGCSNFAWNEQTGV